MPKIETFTELLERAKVAQQVVRGVEFDRLGSGDAGQLAKLDSAIQSFASIASDAEAEPAVAASAGQLAADVAPVTTTAPRAEAPAAPVPVASSAAGVGAAAGAREQATAAGAAAGVAPAPAATVQAATAPAATATPPRAPAVAGAPAPAPAARPAARAAPPAAPPLKPKPKPVVTPSTAPTTFDEQLSKGLYTRRLRRVFVTGRGQGMVPIANLPHRDGLPEFDNCLAPDDSPVEGAYGVFVSPTAVFTAVLRHPMETRRWRVIESIKCSQQKEVVDAVAHLLRRPTHNLEVPEED